MHYAFSLCSKASAWPARQLSNGPMPRGIRSRVARRSARGATTAMQSGSPNGSAVFRGYSFEVGFDLTLRPARLEQPLFWRQPKMIFVNSMSDLFHKRVPFAFVDKIFDTMERADWHTFQILTKRSSRLRDYVARTNSIRWLQAAVLYVCWVPRSIKRRKAAAKRLYRLDHNPGSPRARRSLQSSRARFMIIVSSTGAPMVQYWHPSMSR